MMRSDSGREWVQKEAAAAWIFVPRCHVSCSHILLEGSFAWQQWLTNDEILEMGKPGLNTGAGSSGAQKQRMMSASRFMAPLDMQSAVLKCPDCIG